MSLGHIYRLPPGITRHCFNPGPVQVIPVLNKAIEFIGHNCACLSSNNCAKHKVNSGLKLLQPTNKHWFMKDTPVLPRLSGVPGGVKLTGNAVTPFSAGIMKDSNESGEGTRGLSNLWSCYPEKLKQRPADLRDKTDTKLLISEHPDSGVESLSESDSEGAITPGNVFIANWDRLGQESFVVQKAPKQPEYIDDSTEINKSSKHNPLRIVVMENAGEFSDEKAWKFSEKFENYIPAFKTIEEEPSSQVLAEEPVIQQETVLIVSEKFKVKNNQENFGIKRDYFYQEEVTRL